MIIFSDFFKLLSGDKYSLATQIDSLNSRLYRIEQDHKLVIAECRQLLIENYKLRAELKKVYLHDGSC